MVRRMNIEKVNSKIFISMQLVLLLLLFTSTNSFTNSLPVTKEYLTFLEKFGYLKKQTMNFVSDFGFLSTLNKDNNMQITYAIRLFQLNHGLSATGHMNIETMELMATPRCGYLDNDVNGNHGNQLLEHNSHYRNRRFVVDSSSWDKTEITYNVKRYSRKMSHFNVDKDVQKAFMTWSRYTHLTFTRVTSGDADIDIYFVTGAHGDAQRMDGKGGILAHAYPPRFGGDIHFDDDEAWVATGGYKGVINFYQVAVHEIGHSLGLAHSKHKEATMYPSYKGYEPNYSLSQDDIDGIAYKYGGVFYRGANDVERCRLP